METQVYKMSVDEILKKFGTTKEGITEQEAKERQGIYGWNRLAMKKKNRMFLKFLMQFTDFMVIILLISGVISFFLEDYVSTAVLFVIVIINATVGFVQEFKAERAMESLKSLVQSKAKVMRNGKIVELNAEEVVPGDIVIVEEGDRVPADLRIMEENEFSTNDFSLTGESNPVRKFIQKIEGEVLLGDRNNMVFMGTTAATGNAKGIVSAIGMKTEIGRIANLSISTETELSPLQKQLNNIAKRLTWIALVLAVLSFGLGWFRGSNVREAFMFAVAIALAIVPQGIPGEVSVALSLSAARLAKKKAVVKKLSAAETMGSVHIICTDKTGTLTKNEMTVEKFLIGETEFFTTGIGYEPQGKIIDNNKKELTKEQLNKFELFFKTGVFASNARISSPDKEHASWYSIGDPTEAALITFAEKAGFNQKKLEEGHKEIKEFPFDAVRKMMSSVREIEKGKYRVFVKGAPLEVLKKSIKCFDGEKLKEMGDQEKDFYIEKNKNYADQALRVLALAYKDPPSLKLRRTSEEDGVKEMEMEEAEKDLTFLGFAAMIDPPREEVKDAISAAKEAHIRVIIITGDAARTAEAIAKKIGLVGEDGKDLRVIKGDELGKMSDIVLLQNLISKYIIFSRTSPEDKLRIVDLLKRAGEIVAVTGDGVNDAPALKRADIGVAMGKTGTEVAKESSEIILLDDSFGTLVTAIREGRIIYANLKKTIICNLDLCGAELFTVLWGLVFTYAYGLPAAILGIQILAIDALAETLPLTFLTWDKGEDDLMKETPRNPNEYILDKSRLIDIGWGALLLGGFAYLNFILLGVREGISWANFTDLSAPIYLRATTLTYVTLVFEQLFANILSRRTKKGVFSSYLWSNPRLLIAYGFSIIAILNISYNPYIQRFFHSGPLTVMDWLMALLMAVLYLGIREGWKKIRA